jgi:glucosyl-dolichyl phosphate glucuronosyltransferase
MRITVAIGTWNRCEILRGTLEQMTRLEVPNDVEWELIVVNNRCSDATDEVIRSFRDRLPVRRAWEPEPGASNARNRAIAEATGEYIVWVDDDILVDQQWLAAYSAAFRRWPEAAVLGGPIDPLFEGDAPGWISEVIDQIGPVYGRQTFGVEPVLLTPEVIGRGPYGGNMAMRRDVLERFRFDPRLGPHHATYAVGEETELIRTMLASGAVGWWTPEPRVRHWVPRESQTLAYVRRWMVGNGRYIARHPELDGSLPRNVPYRLYARIVRHEIQYRIRKPFAPPEVWIRDLIRSSRARGRLLESRRMGTRSWV